MHAIVNNFNYAFNYFSGMPSEILAMAGNEMRFDLNRAYEHPRISKQTTTCFSTDAHDLRKNGLLKVIHAIVPLPLRDLYGTNQ